jgi:hypothetical protein
MLRKPFHQRPTAGRSSDPGIVKLVWCNLALAFVLMYSSCSQSLEDSIGGFNELTGHCVPAIQSISTLCWILGTDAALLQ